MATVYDCKAKNINHLALYRGSLLAAVLSHRSTIMVKIKQGNCKGELQEKIESKVLSPKILHISLVKWNFVWEILKSAGTYPLGATEVHVTVSRPKLFLTVPLVFLSPSPFPTCSHGLNFIASRNKEALVSTLKSVSHFSDMWIFIDRAWDRERKERDRLSRRQ